MVFKCRLDNSRPVKQMFPGGTIEHIAIKRVHHTNPDGRCRLALRMIGEKGMKGKLFPMYGEKFSLDKLNALSTKGIHLALDGRMNQADAFVDVELELFLKEVC